MGIEYFFKGFQQDYPVLFWIIIFILIATFLIVVIGFVLLIIWIVFLVRKKLAQKSTSQEKEEYEKASKGFKSGMKALKKKTQYIPIKGRLPPSEFVEQKKLTRKKILKKPLPIKKRKIEMVMSAKKPAEQYGKPLPQKLPIEQAIRKKSKTKKRLIYKSSIGQSLQPPPISPIFTDFPTFE